MALNGPGWEDSLMSDMYSTVDIGAECDDALLPFDETFLSYTRYSK
jgi:hypothetical protein